MTPAFNLLDEPWIPVRSHTGAVLDVNLTNALLRSRDYSALAETSPPNLIALHRLLLALLHRALTTHHGKWNDKDRARWFKEKLPEAPIRAYLAQWRERFWLFHPSKPFMQVAALADEEKTKNKFKPWSQLALELSGGDTPLVFNHSQDANPEPAAYARVLRSLVGYLQFTPGGLVKTFKTSDFAGPLASTAAVMPIGVSLAETLLLALHPWSRGALEDLPSWERPPHVLSNILSAPSLPTGHNDRYTRITRSVLLLKERDVRAVRFIHFGEGCALKDDNLDPMVSCRIKDGEPRRISFAEGRSIWRDLPSMVPDSTKTYDIQAASLAWAVNLYETLGESSTDLNVIVGGWKNAQNKAAKIMRWRLDRIALPAELLINEDSARFLRWEIREAETFYSRLRGLMSKLIAESMPYSGEKTRSKSSQDKRSIEEKYLDASATAAVYFSSAERALPRLMRQIAEGEIDAADNDWKATLIGAAEQSWAATRRGLGDSPAVLRADARIWPRFRGLLKTLVQPTAEDANQVAIPTKDISA